jgi:peptidoglycan/xylan/chitin deacetylase (PgdA/CDA1 family)
MSHQINKSKYCQLALALSLTTLCAAAACSERTSDSTLLAQQDLDCAEYPETDFSPAPAYIGRHVFALTYDDGPDTAGATTRVLDVLRNQYPTIKASFFVNTANMRVNNVTVDDDPALQDVIRRIVLDGHEISNHTKGHDHLASDTPDVIATQISSVQTTINQIFGATAPRLTRIRAPYGEPYGWPRDANELAKVAPIIAANGVHVAWNIDSNDWRCDTGDVKVDAACACNNIKTEIERGAYGIILMHSIEASSALATSCIIDYLRSKTWNGQPAEFWTTEQIIQAKFGKSSAAVVDGRCGGGAGGNTGAGGTPGVRTCTKPTWNSVAQYLKGAEIMHGSKEYRAKWWTSGDVPDQNSGEGKPWELLWSCQP